MITMIIKNLISIIVISSLLFGSFQNKLTKEEDKIIMQAKSLQKSGLHEEAFNLYYNLFNIKPHL